MKWKKLGQIFNPLEHTLANNCKYFAQSPQVLVLDTSYRVYFSTRTMDEFGKYVSHVAFAEFDKNFSKVLKVSDETIIKQGDLGTFDEHGIFPMNILVDGDEIFGYTSGWFRRESVLVDSAIGLTASRYNGLTFERLGIGPVLGPSLHEPFLIADPFVIKDKNTYHMWYVYGKKWIEGVKGGNPDRIYKIGHAISSDQLNWEKEGRQILPDSLGQIECQALPTVAWINDRWHMYFCYRYATDFRTNPQRAYRLGYAFSFDLKEWIRDDENAGIERSDNGWDSEMMCYPFLFSDENKHYLLYNGNDFGRFGFGLAVLEGT
jgi:predicted GH43/DUF377 family glycosyl hydrolase